MTNEQIDASIKFLQQSPIFAMSLGSKELFHSNFWAWLLKIDSDYIKVFFKDLKGEKVASVERESHNIDITITMEGGQKFIIENKIKTIPDDQQLIKYKATTHNFRKGLLTGLAPTLDLNNLTNWDFLSYSDICQSIRTITEQSKNETIISQKEIIFQYCDTVEAIVKLVQFYLEQSVGKLDYNSGKLKDIKFDDVYKKFKVHEFQKYFKENNNRDELEFDGFELSTGTSFNNKHATFDARYRIKGIVEVGVQLEEDQFRIFACRGMGSKCESVFKEFVGYDWFDKEFHKKDNQTIKGRKTNMSPRQNKQYNKYEKDYSFVYQYFIINDTNNDFNSLSKLIISFLKEARKLIENNLSKIVPNQS